jgi:predicted nuclease of predicted toxin-antitoxin system
MKVKLDKNFDVRLVSMLTGDGHDVDTVKSERLSGKPDDTIYETCCARGRVVLTLDKDFSNPFRFPPENTEGIIVLRVPQPILPVVRATLASVLPLLKTQPIKGKLWIVEPGRIRVYDPTDEGE